MPHVTVDAEVDLDDVDEAAIIEQAVRIARRFGPGCEPGRHLAEQMAALRKALSVPARLSDVEDDDPLLPPPSTAARVSSVEEAKRLAVGAAQ